VRLESKSNHRGISSADWLAKITAATGQVIILLCDVALRERVLSVPLFWDCLFISYADTMELFVNEDMLKSDHDR
jgi:hypothetical protein